jgi:hypothetical protein
VTDETTNEDRAFARTLLSLFNDQANLTRQTSRRDPVTTSPAKATTRAGPTHTTTPGYLP